MAGVVKNQHGTYFWGSGFSFPNEFLSVIKAQKCIKIHPKSMEPPNQNAPKVFLAMFLSISNYFYVVVIRNFCSTCAPQKTQL